MHNQPEDEEAERPREPVDPVVRYISNYMDAVENLPDELTRKITRILDLDVSSHHCYKQLSQYSKILENNNPEAHERTQLLTNIQDVLIRLQDIGDEKLSIVQTIHIAIENKARELDINLKNLQPKLEQENNQPSNTLNSNAAGGSSRKRPAINTEKTTQKGRRIWGKKSLETTTQLADSTVLSENQSANLSSTSTGTQKKATVGRKKRKKSPSTTDRDSEDGEPRYCLCNRISFGKMIMCDNDACQQEWFHFSCVKLTAKPKGKWYCPSCRGSKANVPKGKFR